MSLNNPCSIKAFNLRRCNDFYTKTKTMYRVIRTAMDKYLAVECDLTQHEDVQDIMAYVDSANIVFLTDDLADLETELHLDSGSIEIVEKAKDEEDDDD